MARTRTISDEQILDAAQAVFLEQGPQATTSAIADRAGISEGTIFKRFPTKQALFFAGRFQFIFKLPDVILVLRQQIIVLG